jgi:hypothetical protein
MTDVVTFSEEMSRAGADHHGGDTIERCIAGPWLTNIPSGNYSFQSPQRFSP